jgi:glutaminase
VQTAIDIGAGTPSSMHPGQSAAAADPAADPAAFNVDRHRSAEPVASPVLSFLERLHGDLASMTAGSVAGYIPELSRADPTHFGIAIATVDGALYEVGDTRRPFTLQSISKPLTYALVLDDLGEAEVRDRIGVEPTGEAFNSISLSPARGTPLNPMVNAGAIAAAGLIAERDGRPAFDRILASYSRWAGRSLAVDESVYRSERDTGFRNRAIAHLLRSTDALADEPDAAVDRYFRQCSVAADARDLAWIAATLAAGGRHPITGDRVADQETVRSVLSVMATCGMYDGSGQWLYEIGLPAKSGVSGGVIAVLPGQLGVAVYSPRVDEHGNSVRGVAVCRQLAASLGPHLLASGRMGGPVVRTRRDLTTARSARARTESASSRLREVGSATAVLEVQGAVTFLAVETIARDVIARPAPTDVVILDLRRVGRTDGCVVSLLADLGRDLAARGGGLVLAGPAAADLAAGAPGTMLAFDDLDAALEWAEDRLLHVAAPATQAALELAGHPFVTGLTRNSLDRLQAILVRRRWRPGEVVVRRGDPADELYLIAAGELTASVALPSGGRRRLSTLSAGTTLGELAFVGGGARTADVIADTEVEAWVLRHDAFAAFAATDPIARAQLLENLLGAVAGIARRMTAEVELLAG